ncbi:hypothetical protein P4H27_03260 [Paenibacillus taichungensis]|jgi:hypothetical protein|uniref:Uncharacterized protein n=1 Tax=Paenibacillus taichungensis TaxID=484184 RepID=A0ABX2MR33_9BACL|nr:MULTISPECIES: hypothetical protein [Paenibacillus]OME83245.1 hypothetical protein BK122_07210 [Paenibacillus pabuli]MDR9745583.1 hypothetical protein [Paenibacillus taichungensis]MEC0105944.1 hypothetical protein [Paenibacillus taichungensis]MEC0196633.1 hypothetical protein [Paenibacillus taichungensis]NUU56480.1 hypothetical protein [Paenibacillus taichungensis]
MACVKAVPQPDLVLIYWSRNPLVPGSARRIRSVRVIGNTSPCTFTLVRGALLINALNCLLDNDIGFKVVYSKKTSNISGVLLLKRRS